MEEVKKVYFSCKKKLLSNGQAQKNCVCEGCHKTSTVNVIKLPRTLYYSGDILSTKYLTRWYCDECTGKLYKAIVKNRIKYLFCDDGIRNGDDCE